MSNTDSFIETHFVKVQVPETMGHGYAYMGPYYEIDAEETIPVEHEMIPPGETAIRKGARVDANDGRIGRIDKLLIDPVTRKISHLVLRKGHLWGQRDVVIPVDQIELIGEDVVHLKLDKQAVEALPAQRTRQ